MNRTAAFLLPLAVAASAVAAASRPPDAQALGEAKREAQAAEQRSARFEREAQEATDEAARARAEAEALVARIEAAEADLTAAEARIAIIEAMQAEQRARLAERQGPVVRLTGALQTMARRPPALALVQPGSLDDAVHVRALLAGTLPEVRRRTAALRAEVEQGERLRAQADQARAALAERREELRRRRAALAGFEAQQRERSASLIDLALLESDRALALGEEARALAGAIGTRQHQAELARRLAELPGPLPRPGSNAGEAGRRPNYLLPVEGRVVTGMGEISDAGVHARGITLAVAPGAQVIAPAPGRVAFAAPFRGYGRVVILDHGGGWTTVITDLAEIEVEAGGQVRRGAAIGRAGADDPRVSIELRRGGSPIPPTRMIAG